VADYRVPVLEKYGWQPPIISRLLSSPPGLPFRGDRYIVAPIGSGDWVGEDNNIAFCSNATGPVWTFTPVKEGMIAWITSDGAYYYYDGSAWQPFNTTSDVDARRYALLVGAP
jgi:hypothetical protein